MKKHDPLTHPALDIPLLYSPQLAGAPDAVYPAGSKTHCFAYILKAMQFAVLGASFLWIGIAPDAPVQCGITLFCVRWVLMVFMCLFTLFLQNFQLKYACLSTNCHNHITFMSNLLWNHMNKTLLQWSNLILSYIKHTVVGKDSSIASMIYSYPNCKCIIPG